MANQFFLIIGDLVGWWIVRTDRPWPHPDRGAGEEKMKAAGREGAPSGQGVDGSKRDTTHRALATAARNRRAP
jgi:hypothetical protein